MCEGGLCAWCSVSWPLIPILALIHLSSWLVVQMTRNARNRWLCKTSPLVCCRNEEHRRQHWKSYNSMGLGKAAWFLVLNQTRLELSLHRVIMSRFLNGTWRNRAMNNSYHFITEIKYDPSASITLRFSNPDSTYINSNVLTISGRSLSSNLLGSMRKIQDRIATQALVIAAANPAVNTGIVSSQSR